MNEEIFLWVSIINIYGFRILTANNPQKAGHVFINGKNYSSFIICSTSFFMSSLAFGLLSMMSLSIGLSA